MDAATELLALLNTMAQIHLLWLQSLPEAQRAEVAKMQLDDLKATRTFFAPLIALFASAPIKGTV